MENKTDKIIEEMIKLLAVFAGVVIAGILVVELLPFGYVEASILYLAGVVGAGFYGLGHSRAH